LIPGSSWLINATYTPSGDIEKDANTFGIFMDVSGKGSALRLGKSELIDFEKSPSLVSV